ncbi:Tetratricopeptide repeat-containing protein [Desulfurella multipotens]|uniref:Tetratricopeptide repeat-containing protein n=1 Tax=Desulfurella multipotens TaxID=79269 RepID=A0A1G6NHZ7_9BACT|nr:tetratricopeptide repeat protein [Desulfurella multipotens]SDC66966.1 Tetratricopeptide repeat-containing protein [Desulfurella multipotens]
MADDKDKIIVIEEEPNSKEETQLQQKQQEVPEEEEKNPLLVPKKRPVWLFLGTGIVFLIAAAIFVFFSKSPVPKKITKPQPQKVVKTKENLDLHFIEGLNLENKGNLKQAIEEFKKSKNYLFLAYINIAKIYQMQNNQQMAYEYIKKANDYLHSTFSNPNEYIDSYMYLFSYYMQNNHFNEAKDLLKDLQNANIKNHEIDIMNVYYDFLTQKDVKNVLNNIDQMLKKGYKDRLLYEMLGYIYAKENNYPKAKEYFSKVGNSSVAEHNMAFLQFAQNNLENALNYAIESLNKKLDPKLAYFAYLLALKSNNMQTAYNLISNIDTQDVVNDFSIVPTLDKQELLKQINYKDCRIICALQSLIIMQSIDPIHYSANLASNIDLGNIYLSFGLMSQAKESYMSAISESYSLNQANKAYAYFKENNLRQALNYYQKAYQSNPSNPILYYNLALMYEKNYNFDKAKQMFSVLINRYPNFPLPYFNMALIDFTQGSTQTAKNYLNQFFTKQSSLGSKPKSVLVCNDYALSLVNKLKEPKNISVEDFVLLKAISDGRFDYLKLEKKYLNDKLHLNMKNFDMVDILEALRNFNPDLNRIMADLYLIENKPEKAIRTFTNINDYNAQDYYKMALCYLLLGYKTQADDYLTKSILLNKNTKDSNINPLFAKLIIQIMNKNLNGMQDLTKKVNSNKGLLSFDIEVKK